MILGTFPRLPHTAETLNWALKEAAVFMLARQHRRRAPVVPEYPEHTNLCVGLSVAWNAPKHVVLNTACKGPCCSRSPNCFVKAYKKKKKKVESCQAYFILGSSPYPSSNVAILNRPKPSTSSLQLSRGMFSLFLKMKAQVNSLLSWAVSGIWQRRKERNKPKYQESEG